MNIFKFIYSLFKKNVIEKNDKLLTESEIIYRQAQLRAKQMAMEKRERFLFHGGIRYRGHSFIDNADDYFDKAYNDVWNEHHRF